MKGSGVKGQTRVVVGDTGGVSRREIVILGSTGSIGTQALDVVARNPQRFQVVALAAGGAHVDLLAEQAATFAVDLVAISDPDQELPLRAALERRGVSPKVLVGPDAASQAAAWPCDTVLNGMTGSIGLGPTLAALEAGRTLALANKESLVAGGSLVTDLAAPGQIVPVDSEHSALAQALRGGHRHEVRRLLLTASGGPFRGYTRALMADVTPAQALAHPTWTMGTVVTTNSATLINKGLELIEAQLLFGVSYEAIEVVVHPQSMIHSMVEFIDGSVLAQVSPPDMRLPIALALGWPDRVPEAAPACDWSTAQHWTFEPLDTQAFPAVALCRRAGMAGGVAPAVLNAANEVCVEAFHSGRLPFLGIVDTVADVVEDHLCGRIGNPRTLADVLSAEAWARARARELVGGTA